MATANINLKRTPKSSRLGTRNYPQPEPLRFKTVKDAAAHIRANKMKVKTKTRHQRGIRIDVVDANGKARTISVPKKDTKKDTKDASS